jgi:hypothetical protein
MTGFCDDGDEPSDCRELLEQLNKYRLLGEDPALWSYFSYLVSYTYTSPQSHMQCVRRPVRWCVCVCVRARARGVGESYVGLFVCDVNRCTFHEGAVAKFCIRNPFGLRSLCLYLSCEIATFKRLLIRSKLRLYRNPKRPEHFAIS